MPILQAIQVAQLVRDVGITGEAAVIAVAVSKGESNFDSDVAGDTTIQTSKWGPSIGLWQVRSLKAEYGTGGTRDASRLTDPMFNARSMHSISAGGTNWQPWTIYTNGSYRNHLDEARQAVGSLGGTGVTAAPLQGATAPTIDSDGNPVPATSTISATVEQTALASPTPAITPPPTASLVAGLGTYGPTELHLEGRKLSGLAEIVTADLDRTIDDAASLVVQVIDTHNKLLESGLLDERSRTSVDTILFELIGVARYRRDLTLTFIDAAAADYINDKLDTPITQAPGTGSRGDFLRLLADRAPWVPVDIETGADPIIELATPDDANVWEALGQIASEVGWRRLVVANRLLIGSEEWLASRTPPIAIREGAGGVDRIEFDFLVGEDSSRASVTCDAKTWAAPPSQAVEITGLGPASGVWLVTGVSRKLGSTQARVELGRVQSPLAEPVPPPPPENYDDSGLPTYDPGTGGVTTPGVSDLPAVQTGAVSADGWIWPMPGRIASGFGPRKSPGGIGSKNHAGIDIAGPTGTPIVAMKGGTVTVAGTAGGYGNAVYIDHGGGLFSRYGHMQRVLCTRGQRVAQGQTIGLCDSTGNSTGPHVHAEIRPGDVAQDPLKFLPPR